MYRAFVESGFSHETKMKSFFRRLEDYLQAGRKWKLVEISFDRKLFGSLGKFQHKVL